MRERILPQVLNAVLDQLEDASTSETVTIDALVKTIGPQAFTALMLVFALVAISPASVVPGVTSAVGLIEAMLAAQMIMGRPHLWLPGFIAQRGVAGARLGTAVGWLRKPIGFIDRILRPRLSFMTEKPWILPWLIVVFCLGLIMPFMELIPTSGTIIATFIALVAAAMLTRDGLLLVLAAGVLALIAWVLRWFIGIF